MYIHWKQCGWWLVDIYFPLRDDCSCMYLLLILLSTSNTGNQPNLHRFGCSWFLYIITALCSSFTTNWCLCDGDTQILQSLWACYICSSERRQSTLGVLKRKVSNVFVMCLLYGRYPNTELYLQITVLPWHKHTDVIQFQQIWCGCRQTSNKLIRGYHTKAHDYQERRAYPNSRHSTFIKHVHDWT